MSKIKLMAVATAIGLTSPALAEPLKPGWSGIAEELFQNFIISEGLKELGYEVAEPSQVQIQLAHVTVGTGDLDYYPSHSVPLHNAFFEEAGGDDKLVRLGLLVPDGMQGYLIDKKTANDTGISHLEDLIDPEKAKLFDINGNGKADIYGCEPGWGCERIIEHHLDAYGLRDTVEHNQGSYFAIMADAIQRIEAGQPTLYYTWTPLWVSAVLRPGEEVSWLTVNETSLPASEVGGETTVEGIGNVGFPVFDQLVLANKAFVEENPKAKNFLEEVTIPLADINAQNLLMYEGEDSQTEIMSHAKHWISDNQSKWDSWITQAQAASE